MVYLDDLIHFLDEYMEAGDHVASIDGYLANGLQVAGKQEVTKIVTGVSANLQFFEKAQAAGAQALLVHHSLVPPSTVHFEKDTAFTQRLKYLWTHDLSLIGYHYLLDRHPKVGHNASIIRELGGELVAPYSKDWGWVGEIPNGGANRDQLIATCKRLFKDNGYYYPFGPKQVKRLICLTGSGAPRSSDYAWLVGK